MKVGGIEKLKWSMESFSFNTNAYALYAVCLHYNLVFKIELNFVLSLL